MEAEIGYLGVMKQEDSVVGYDVSVVDVRELQALAREFFT